MKFIDAATASAFLDFIRSIFIAIVRKIGMQMRYA